MLTEEEKREITERLRAELQIRSELQPPPPAPPKHAWLQSPLSLLVAGFILTGVLVPLLQFSQETIKWRRANRYENTKYRLTMMRECLKEFVYLWALTAEAYQRSQAIGASVTEESANLNTLKEKFSELENRRYEQNAKIVSLMIFFPEREKIWEQFNAFLHDYQLFNESLRRTVQERYGGSSPTGASAVPNAVKSSSIDLDNSLMVLNQGYEALAEIMKQQIRVVESDSETFM